MDVTPLIRRDAQVIQAYKGGAFKISGHVYSGPVIVMPDRVVPWDINGEPVASHFEVLRPYLDQVEVLLFGTGARLVMPGAALRREVKANLGLNLEAMDTGAASRTYNVLMAEGRKVAAALTLFY